MTKDIKKGVKLSTDRIAEFAKDLAAWRQTPPPQTQEVTVMAALTQLKDPISKLTEQGYSVGQIVEKMGSWNLGLSEATLKNYLQRTIAKKGKSESTPTDGSPGVQSANRSTKKTKTTKTKKSAAVDSSNSAGEKEPPTSDTPVSATTAETSPAPAPAPAPAAPAPAPAAASPMPGKLTATQLPALPAKTPAAPAATPPVAQTASVKMPSPSAAAPEAALPPPDFLDPADLNSPSAWPRSRRATGDQGDSDFLNMEDHAPNFYDPN